MATLLRAAAAMAVVSIEVGNAVIDASGHAKIDVVLRTGGADVGGTQNDLVFDASAVRLASAAACRINPAIGDRLAACEEDPVVAPCKTLSRRLASCAEIPTFFGCEDRPAGYSVFRAIIAATAIPNNNSIADGTVLYSCDFIVEDRARLPILLFSVNDGAASPVGERLDAQTKPGFIAANRLQTPPPTPSPNPFTPTRPHTPTPSETPLPPDTPTPSVSPTPSATPTPGPVSLELRSDPTDDGAIIARVILHDGGNYVAGLQVDLTFDRRLLRLDNFLECHVDPGINTSDPACDDEPVTHPCKSFHRELADCDSQPKPGLCEQIQPYLLRFRATIGSPINANRIPDGQELFACKLLPLADRGSVTIEGSGVASAPDGAPLETRSQSLPVSLDHFSATFPPARTATPLRALGNVETVVGSPFDVEGHPDSIALADFDADGFQDVIASLSAFPALVVLLNDGSGNFGSRHLKSIPAPAGALTILPGSGDGSPAIAGSFRDPQAAEAGLFEIPQGGSITAPEQPEPQSIPGTHRATTLFAGNLDKKNGPDLATANGRRWDTTSRHHDVSILLDRGNDRGFVPAVHHALSAEPDVPAEIDGGDLDDDGDIDLVVLDDASDTLDDIILLINDGKGRFSVEGAFFLGTSVRSLAVTDVDNDGTLDIALASDDSTNHRQSLSMLRNAPREARRLHSSGSFFHSSPLTIPCPDTWHGVPIECHVRDLSAGDFNSDERTDLVVLLDTTAGDAAVHPPGLLAYFAGVEDGFPYFARMVEVGAGATSMAVGDMTGDGIDDVVVAAGIDGTITTVRSVERERLSLGDRCSDADSCASGYCSNGVCCTETCPYPFRCDTTGFEGQCRFPFEAQSLGEPCARDEHCESGFCVDSTCCERASCRAGESCAIPRHAGHCFELIDLPSCCSFDSDCSSRHCMPGAGPDGCFGACGPARTPTPLAAGSACNGSALCPAGFTCNTREAVCCEMAQCPTGTYCRDDDNPGFCRPLPTPEPGRTPVINGASCSPNRPNSCSSGNCVNNTCCDEPSCPVGERCDIFSLEGRCLPPLQAGEPCEKNTDCLPGLRCMGLDDPGSLRCSFLLATPTLLPTGAPTPTYAATPLLSRSQEDGCAIGATESRPSLLPFALLGIWLSRAIRRRRSK